MMNKKIAVVLSGGGARGAYQVGVLSGLAEVLKKHQIKPEIKVYTGVSAGAINAAFLASQCDDFQLATQKLTDLWSNLTSDQVFASDALHMGKIAVTWATELGFGALAGTTPGKALLNTGPLEKLITEQLKLNRIKENIANGHLDALALTAVDYATSNSITFVQGKEDLPIWNKPRRRSEKCQMSVKHVMASSAIPLLFPAAQVDDRWFGDGCVRNTHPCSSALYLGAEKLFVVGVRRRSLTAEEVSALKSTKGPSVARVLNLLLNAVLLDGVELDIERLERVNQFIQKVPPEHRDQLNFKSVDYVMISPSADIGALASAQSTRLPRIIRYLLKGLGSLEEASEIISYLLFDPEFCKLLIQIGHKDALAEEEKIVKLFS